MYTLFVLNTVLVFIIWSQFYLQNQITFYRCIAIALN